ncbi:hypothetical protein FLBR109950_09100 [Flavobacterium branchiophilum]|uniref:Uncharacterized protein n=1 Tax=Flavobacterium branchiophilum (strain FL-15) TaxID=1034807 RepID=G2Z1N0_FLABF|nr:hypothetical protein [Flavobacterium branchiophilum]CCB69804.1 Hypothetical protein FBFL15_1744 [Flavobacterium branchiophilum FL-15]
MNNIDQILEKNYEQLDILKNELTNLKEIKAKITELSELPLIFNERFKKIIKTTNDFTTTLGGSVNVFLKGNNDLLVKNNSNFTNKLNELNSEITRLNKVDFKDFFKDLERKFLESTKVEISKELKKFDEKVANFQMKISELNSEITRLSEIDFNALFEDLERKFLENSKFEIGKELKKFDEKATNFQTKVDDLGKEVSRLSKIDLEKHFNKHQNKLSEIFIAINGINTIIANISHNINSLIQKFGDIEQTLSKNQKEINKGFDSLTQSHEKTTNDLLNKIKESDSKLDAIVSQNELLKKELDFNKKLNFAIIIFVIISIIVKFI